MTPKMLLVKLARTNGVLASASRSAAGAPAAAALLGAGGLWVEDPDGTGHLEIAVENLAVDEVDWNEDAFVEPLVFGARDGGAAPVGQTVAVTLAAAGLTISLPAGMPPGTKAWLQVEGGPQARRVSLEAEVPTPAPASWAVALPLDSGTYRFLVSVEGCQTEVGKQAF
jgi:hypothetical protein